MKSEFLFIKTSTFLDLCILRLQDNKLDGDEFGRCPVHLQLPDWEDYVVPFPFQWGVLALVLGRGGVQHPQQKKKRKIEVFFIVFIKIIYYWFYYYYLFI